CIGLAAWFDPALDYIPLIEVAGQNGRPPRHGQLGYGQGGPSMFSVHIEVPVSGHGEAPSDCLVLERGDDGRLWRTPYFDWCRGLDLQLNCPRCRKDVLDPATEFCHLKPRRVPSWLEEGIPLLDDPSTWPKPGSFDAGSLLRPRPERRPDKRRRPSS
ncbi:MAG: hypothetical protein HKN04_15550, partial [Rhodothermaceae bacterium]|nr:hypothetical protein [Rhodothermaceae bacterium]